jgi:hypothetical protein
MSNETILAITPLKMNSLSFFLERKGICMSNFDISKTRQATHMLPALCINLRPSFAVSLLCFFFSAILEALAVFLVSAHRYLVLHYVFQALIIIINILNEYINFRTVCLLICLFIFGNAQLYMPRTYRELFKRAEGEEMEAGRI